MINKKITFLRTSAQRKADFEKKNMIRAPLNKAKRKQFLKCGELGTVPSQRSSSKTIKAFLSLKNICVIKINFT
jgi:hypothetical protein